ncbi:MAG: transglycosylase SLT domain-containing protein [Anaerolineales bacterium]|nr:transglycosylase SLT domain-containing protein [Anaerolineales bacterium]
MPASNGADHPPVALPAELRNWQVLEIDGSADPVDDADRGEHEREGAQKRIPDRQDESIAATMALRLVDVEAGSPATLSLSVLNNGPHVARFEVLVEGWVDTAWVQPPSLSPAVEPGERITLTVDITPPRQPNVEAGDYHVALLVRSPAYPDCATRLGAVLRILPFALLELTLGERPATPISWLHRSTVVPLSVANWGNTPVRLVLRGSTPQDGCSFAFAAPINATGDAVLALRPSQVTGAPERITVSRPPWFGGRNFLLPFQIDADSAGMPNLAPRRVRSSLVVQPLVGPWQVATLAGLSVAGVLGILILAMGLFLATQLARPAATPIAQAPQAAPPVIIVNLNQPVAAPVAAAGDSSAASVAATDGGALNPALPLVLPDQVTNPGSGGPIRRVTPAQTTGLPDAQSRLGPQAGAPASVAANNSASLTYGQMFEEIGQSYDLDWRMLAAQAYVESGFDTLALSDAGAMGLMQILPGTWREWAPSANASDPFDSYSNVLVAAVYLDHLRTIFAAKGYPAKEWMLVAYNWGPERLNDFLAGGGLWSTLPEARRQYADDILRIAQTIP